MTIAARALALATVVFALSAPAFAATPTPKPAKYPALHTPTVPLHTEFVVEVNKKGQVVRVKSGKSSKDKFYNAQTYGNVLQMWIRHPDGTAEVGLYKVTYDYNPSTKKVRRDVSIVSAGGNWGDQQGAADEMIDTANKQAKEAQSHGTQLPALDKIVASPSPHP